MSKMFNNKLAYESTIPAPTLIPTTLPTYTIALTITSCSTSVLGALAIFLIYYKYPSIRTTSRQFLVFLTFADLLTASGNLVGVVRYIYKKDDPASSNTSCAIGNASDALCIAQSFVTTYSSLSSFFWTAAISFFILMPVAGRCMFGRKYKISCHIFCWLVPGVIVITAAVTRKLGEDRAHTSGGWCWISGCLKEDDKLAWMIMTGKGWEILVYLITAVNYILLKYLWFKHEHSIPWPPGPHYHREEEYVFKDEDKHFLYVPVVLYLLRVWGTVRFFLSFIADTQKVADALLPLQGIGDSGQAFWNFILFFALDASIRSKICSASAADRELEVTTSVRETTRLLQNT